MRKVSNKNRRYSNIIGSFHSKVNKCSVQYESLAECVLLYSLERNTNVHKYEVQSIEVPVFIGEDEEWFYTPDVLVTYKNGLRELIEVKKTRTDALRKSSLIRQYAGNRFCKQRGWLYTVICEEDLNPIEKRNIKFLFGFRNRNEKYKNLASGIKDLLGDGALTINDVVAAVGSYDTLPLLYCMIFNNEISIKMTEPLTLETKISLIAG